MNPNLMGSPRLQSQCQFRKMPIASVDTVVGAGRLTTINHSHFLTGGRMSTNWLVHCSSTSQTPMHNSQISSRNFSSLQSLDKVGVSALTPSHHHYARRIFIKPMHNTSSR